MDPGAAQILVVEDNPDIRDTMRELLEVEGHRVITACNGQEGLDALAHTRSGCLIVLDLMMPVMDGYEFLELLRQRADADRFGVLVVSADFDVPSTVAEHPGVLGVLRKPFELGDVLRVVHDFQH